ncbi:MAG: GHKL domain-containing protein [Hespellia sp.]|nr:GHKL domain-containing protein [Hespellia sp.]
MKSIKYTAEKYDGTITINTENDIFTLQILLPIRNSEEIDIPIES